MSKIWGTLLVVISLCVGALAQTTSVTGTITDLNGQAFSYGTWQVTFHPNGFPPNTYNVNGASFTQLFSGSMDVNGFFSVTLTDNSQITPTGSQWDFQVCADANVPCTTVTLTITGGAQDVSSAISTLVPALQVKLDPNPNVRPFGRAYTDTNIAVPMEGFTYFNLADTCLHTFTRTGWIKVCGGAGSPGVFNCPTAVNGAVLAATSTTAYSCDRQFLTDFLGHAQAQSYQSLAPYNGELQLTAKNAAQPAALPAGTTSWIAPNAIGTSFRNVMWAALCTDGQTIIQQSHDTDPTGTPRAFWNCGNTAGISITATLPIVVTPSPITGVGVISCPTCNTGASSPQASNPSAPALTTNGAAGTTSYTYLVVGCEDGAACVYHSAASPTTTIATGNATLTSSNSINVKTYGDTLYGYRCYNVYRTASGGTPNTTGKLATCVGKSFIDTGLTGDGTTAPATNTTTLDANGLTNPLPGCNKIPAAPYGIDGPPCVPKALDDEMAATFGAAGDVNSPFWTWQAQGSCTATWTSGMLSMQCPSSGGTSVHCLLETAPATPYKFVSLVYGNWIPTANGPEAGIGFFETASGKFETITMFSGQGVVVRHWTNNTTAGNLVVGNSNSYSNNGYYFRLGADGTNLTLDTSPDGVIYTNAYSELKASFFTTAPDKVGICVNSFGIINAEYDYWRETL